MKKTFALLSAEARIDEITTSHISGFIEPAELKQSLKPTVFYGRELYELKILGVSAA